MLPEQAVIQQLYRQIDEANERLIELGTLYRVVRLVSIEFINPIPRESKEITTSAPTTPTNSGNVCRECGGEMIRTGSCETCQNCGTTSGGCS